MAIVLQREQGGRFIIFWYSKAFWQKPTQPMLAVWDVKIQHMQNKVANTLCDQKLLQRWLTHYCATSTSTGYTSFAISFFKREMIFFSNRDM